MSTQTIPKGSDVFNSNGTIPEREVLRCEKCGIVQYRRRTNRCPWCGDPLPNPTTFTGLLALFASPNPEPDPKLDWETRQKISNHDAAMNIGQRISALRMFRHMSRHKLHEKSGVSRSYLSRVETGNMVPSLGSLEKIAAALGVGLRVLFIPESELLLEDPLIREIGTFLGKLNMDVQWSIFKSLQEIQPKQNKGAVT